MMPQRGRIDSLIETIHGSDYFFPCLSSCDRYVEWASTLSTGLLLVSVAEALDQDWNNNVGTQEFRRSACGTTGNNPKGWQSETGWARGGRAQGPKLEVFGTSELRISDYAFHACPAPHALQVVDLANRFSILQYHARGSSERSSWHPGLSGSIKIYDA